MYLFERHLRDEWHKMNVFDYFSSSREELTMCKTRKFEVKINFFRWEKQTMKTFFPNLVWLWNYLEWKSNDWKDFLFISYLCYDIHPSGDTCDKSTIKSFADSHHEQVCYFTHNSICKFMLYFKSPLNAIIHDYLAALITFTNHLKLKTNWHCIEAK